MATKINTSVSTATYDDAFIKPKGKGKGKGDLVINHEYAGRMAKMHNKSLKKYGDGIISYKPSDEDDFCSFKIQKIKSRSDRMIIKGKKGNCGSLPLPDDSTTISFAWGDFDSYREAEKNAEGLGGIFPMADS